MSVVLKDVLAASYLKPFRMVLVPPTLVFPARLMPHVEIRALVSASDVAHPRLLLGVCSVGVTANALHVSAHTRLDPMASAARRVQTALSVETNVGRRTTALEVGVWMGGAAAPGARRAPATSPLHTVRAARLTSSL